MCKAPSVELLNESCNLFGRKPVQLSDFCSPSMVGQAGPAVEWYFKRYANEQIAAVTTYEVIAKIERADWISMLAPFLIVMMTQTGHTRLPAV